MRASSKERADLFAFTKETFIENSIFCGVSLAFIASFENNLPTGFYCV